MNRQKLVEQLCFLVLDIPDYYGTTEEYVQNKLGKSIKEATDDELSDLLMEIVPNAQGQGESSGN